MFKCCLSFCNKSNSKKEKNVKSKSIQPVNNVYGEDFHTFKFENFAINKYHPVYLGNGISGKVYKITYNQLDLTCKTISKTRYSEAIKEIKILKSLSYEENLPYYYKSIETAQNIYILYSYIRGEELYHLIKNKIIPINDIKYIYEITKQIVLALEALFRYNYIHLDLKPENIIVKNINPIQIALIDLGMCKKLNKKINKVRQMGTVGYASPEVVLFNRFFHNSDVWAIGVIIYILLTGKKLFTFINSNMFHYSLKLKNFKGFKEKKEIVEPLNNNLFDLLKKMLTVNHFYRISIKSILNHRFIKNGC